MIDQTTLAIEIGLFVTWAAIALLGMLAASDIHYRYRRARRRRDAERNVPGYPKTEVIQCPKCGTNQPAQIEFHERWPWPVYCHRCIHCDYIITESDWLVVQPNNTLERKGGAE